VPPQPAHITKLEDPSMRKPGKERVTVEINEIPGDGPGGPYTCCSRYDQRTAEDEKKKEKENTSAAL
jgi:hypothetical protein